MENKKNQVKGQVKDKEKVEGEKVEGEKVELDPERFTK